MQDEDKDPDSAGHHKHSRSEHREAEEWVREAEECVFQKCAPSLGPQAFASVACGGDRRLVARETGCMSSHHTSKWRK